MTMQRAQDAIAESSVMEKVLIDNDLSKLTPRERLSYYAKVCDSLGLNPLTRPFDYLLLNGKLSLYPNKDAAAQITAKYGLTVTVTNPEVIEDMIIVNATATDGKRAVEDVGIVFVGNAKADILANAMLKAVTKAKRRATLSFAGLGWVDESEWDSVPKAIKVDAEFMEDDDGDSTGLEPNQLDLEMEAAKPKDH